MTDHNFTPLDTRIMRVWRFYLPDDHTAYAAVLFGRLSPKARLTASLGIVGAFTSERDGIDLSPEWTPSGEELDNSERRLRELAEDVGRAEWPERFQ